MCVSVWLEFRQPKANLAGQVELSVEWLHILQRVSGDQLLVQPNLVVCGGAGEQVLAHTLSELVGLAVKLGEGWHSRNDDVAGSSGVKV